MSERETLIHFISSLLYGPARMLDSCGYDHAPESVSRVDRLFGMSPETWSALTDEEVRAWAWGIGEAA